MFERFTDRARRAVVLAQEEARSLNHDYIGTEHLLLGLLAEGEGVAARALRELGAEADAVRARIMDMIGRGGTEPDHHIPFTPRAKRTMELSLQEALKLGHNYIGTEHLLLGLLREGEGVASQVLSAIGIDLGATRDKVVQLLAGQGVGGPSARVHPPSARTTTPPRHSPALQAALAQATALAGADLVGTHHLLAVFATIEDAAAPQILDAGGFDASSLPVEISAWDVSGTGDEDPVGRAARGTVLTHDASGMTVRLEDDTLRERIERAIATGRINKEQLREALGRVWADFAGGRHDVGRDRDGSAGSDGTDDHPDDDAPGP